MNEQQKALLKIILLKYGETISFEEYTKIRNELYTIEEAVKHRLWVVGGMMEDWFDKILDDKTRTYNLNIKKCVVSTLLEDNNE